MFLHGSETLQGQFKQVQRVWRPYHKMNLLYVVFQDTLKWLIVCLRSLNMYFLQLLLGSCKGYQAGTSL